MMLWKIVLLFASFRYVLSYVTLKRSFDDGVVKPNELFEYSVPAAAFHSSSGFGGLDFSVISTLPSWLTSQEVGYCKRVGNYSMFEMNCIYSKLKLHDNHAFVAAGECGAIVFDISDLRKPRIVVKIVLPNPDKVEDVEIRYPLLYIVAESNLFIYDITNYHFVPTHLSTLPVGSSVNFGILVNPTSNTAYVVAEGSFYVIDVSNPSTPYIEKEVSCDVYMSPACEVSTNEDFSLFFVSGEDGYVIYSLSPTDPRNITRVHYEGPGLVNVESMRSMGVKAAEDGGDEYAYYIDVGIGIQVLSLKDVSNPFKLGYIAEVDSLGASSACKAMGSYNEKDEVVAIIGESRIAMVDVKGLSSIFTDGSNNDEFITAGDRKFIEFLEDNSQYYLTLVRNKGLHIYSLGGIQFSGTPTKQECEQSLPLDITVRASRKADEKDYNDATFTVECDSILLNQSGERIKGEPRTALNIFLVFFFLSFCWCIVCISVTMLIAILIFCFICFGSASGATAAFFFDQKRKKGVDKIDKIMKEQFISKEDIEEGEKKTHAMINLNPRLFEIKYDNLDVRRMIGKGGSGGTVFYCKWKKTIDVAFKCFQTVDLFGSDNDFSEFEREVKVSSSLRHPNILNFFGCCLYPPRVGIVMEFCSNGDMKHYLEEHPDFSIEERIRILGQICDGMDYLHERNVIHRDVKCENILLDSHLIPKIMDFGISKAYDRMTVAKTRNVGTTFYMAPEIVLGEDYSTSADVFSFAIVMWEVLANEFKNPYGVTAVNIEYKIANSETFRPDVKKISVTYRNKYPLAIELMKKSWSADPRQRPTFKKLKTELMKL